MDLTQWWIDMSLVAIIALCNLAFASLVCAVCAFVAVLDRHRTMKVLEAIHAELRRGNDIAHTTTTLIYPITCAVNEEFAQSTRRPK